MFISARKGNFFLVLVLFLCLAGATHPAQAAVRINEIAWMGTATSSTSEWIELANDAGVSVVLSGWRIEAMDGSPTIALSGSIAANGYYVIERTNDGAVPNVTADLVVPFGTGLSNAGETLNVKDATGAIVDTVVGGKNWVAIGGNRKAKHTAQRLSGTSGWVTGIPTPRAENIRPAPATLSPPVVATIA